MKPRYFRPLATLEESGEKPLNTDIQVNNEVGKIAPNADEELIGQFEEKKRKFVQKMTVIKTERPSEKQKNKHLNLLIGQTTLVISRSRKTKAAPISQRKVRRRDPLHPV